MTPENLVYETVPFQSSVFVHRIEISETKKRPQKSLLHSVKLVRERGLEPPRVLPHWLLRPARLPIPPLAQL